MRFLRFRLLTRSKIHRYSVADPRFPEAGDVDLVGGRGLPAQLRFVKFVCQNERIGSLVGARLVRPLDPPMILHCICKITIPAICMNLNLKNHKNIKIK